MKDHGASAPVSNFLADSCMHAVVAHILFIIRIAKLAGLFIKTLAKPLSKRIKHEFSRYHFTQQILIGIGQTSHAVTSRLTIWSAGYRVRSITPLEPEKAMSTGAEFVGESFILLVSGGTVVWEYNRSKEKERKKEAKIREEARQQREALKAKLVSLDKRIQALEEVVDANSHSPLHFGKVYVAPTNIVAIDDDEELAVTVDLQTTTKPSETSEDDDEEEESESNEASRDVTLRKRLTKVEENKSIWEWFVWRPW